MLRVRTKWYNAFNTGQFSVLGSSMCGWGGAEKLRDRNSITLSPFLLFTSPPLSSLSHLLSFPHVCLLTIALSLFSSNLFAHLLPSSLPSFVLKPHLLSFPHSCVLSHIHPYPPSPFHSVPHFHRHLFPLHSPRVSPLPHLSLWSNLQIHAHTHTFKTWIISNSLTGNIQTLIVQSTKTHS